MPPSSLRVAVAGFKTCPFHKRAVAAVKQLAASGKIASFEEKTFPSRDDYRAWLFSSKGRDSFNDARAKKHTSCPFVFKNDTEFIGGCDDALAFAASLSGGSAKL